MYHGAEHKVIHAYEEGKELTLKNARDNSPLHPRCGTSFPDDSHGREHPCFFLYPPVLAFRL